MAGEKSMQQMYYPFLGNAVLTVMFTMMKVTNQFLVLCWSMFTREMVIFCIVANTLGSHQHF